MRNYPDYKPEFQSVRDLLLEISQERDAQKLLDRIVRRLSIRPHIALVRIWLIKKSDSCPSCLRFLECQDKSRCLHLAASAGRPIAHPQDDFFSINGPYYRLPLSTPTFSKIVETGKGVRIIDVQDHPDWIQNNSWAANEGIVGFGARPLVHRGEVLGILAIYMRIPNRYGGTFWVRMVANLAASATANAQAFEQIETLKEQLELENAYLREELNEVQSFGDIIGQSPPLLNVLKQIELVSPTDASVLILGESGTGKELVAREIHKRSLRYDRPMIKVNCATIPRELFESEFFGHLKGAFTGAVKDRGGRFKAADGGTLFLDEVGEIPLDLQGKFLRVLQEGQYEHVGDDITRSVDVRIIAASNRKLYEEVEAGQFRQDLFYRLNVFPIEVAPLQRRKEDIPLLASHFLKIAAEKFNRSVPRLSEANLDELRNYNWPGNVRELQNIIERSVITSRSGRISFDFPHQVDAKMLSPLDSDEDMASGEVLRDSEMKSRERQNIRLALQRCNGKIYGTDGAARLLGIKPTTLSARIKKMGLKKIIEEAAQ